MGANEITSAIWEMQNRIDVLEAEKSRMISADKLYNLMLTARQVAQMCGVSVRTVQMYAGYGKIPLHPSSTGGKMLFRASEAIHFDFKQIMKDRRRETMFLRML